MVPNVVHAHLWRRIPRVLRSCLKQVMESMRMPVPVSWCLATLLTWKCHMCPSPASLQVERSHCPRAFWVLSSGAAPWSLGVSIRVVACHIMISLSVKMRKLLDIRSGAWPLQYRRGPPFGSDPLFAFLWPTGYWPSPDSEPSVPRDFRSPSI